MKYPKMLIAAAGMAALLALTAPGAEVKAEVELRAALEQETVKGDLKGAIEQYKKIVAAYPQNRAVPARALFHIGECYEKLGQSEAQKAYERVLREYPEQKEAAEARSRLAARDNGSRRENNFVVERILAPQDPYISVAFSPDGRSLVFVDRDSNLVARDRVTGKDRLLTHEARPGTYAESPVFSPDGKQVAYDWSEDFGRGKRSVRLVGLDGKQAREIVNSEHEISPEAWSPDGKWISAVRYNGDKTADILLISTVDGAITRLKSTGWQYPSIGGFSPNGRFLVYSLPFRGLSGFGPGPSPSGGIFAVEVAGSSETLLVQGAANDHSPVWTPDGRAILFVSDRSGTQDLWSIRVENGRPQQKPELIRAQVGNIEPKGFARDGSLYYVASQFDTDVYTAELDPEKLTASAPTRITDDFVGSNYDPALSPDGKLLAFLRYPPGDPYKATRAVVIRSLATGTERTLPAKVISSSGLLWYPDAGALLLEEGDNNRTRFRRIDIGTGEVRTVFEGTKEIGPKAQILSDGKTLLYSMRVPGSPRLIQRDLETGQEAELCRTESPGAFYYAPDLSPNGDWVAFLANTGTNKRSLLTIPVRGGKSHEIYSGAFEALRTGSLAWTRDGRYVIAVMSTNETKDPQLFAFPVAGGEPRPLGISMQQIFYMSVSPDGRRIFFQGGQQKRELWVMRNFLPQS